MVNQARVKEFRCLHEDHCSQPGTYWRYATSAQVLDKHGNVTEDIPSQATLEGVAACTECGNGAELVYPKAVAEESKQEVLL